MILSYVRTLILYLVLIAVVRLMGKRQIGEMEPAEFVVTMLVANLAAGWGNSPVFRAGSHINSAGVGACAVLGHPAESAVPADPLRKARDTH